MMMKNLFDVSGKVAVVSGGSSGIGFMMAQGLLENGAKVYITARKVAQLDDAQKKLSKFGECVAVPSDLSTIDGIEGFVTELSKHEKKLDILINNAGAVWAAPVESFPEQGWDKIMDINVKGLFFMTQKCLPLLKAAGTDEDPARVINIASINGIRNSGMTTYSYTASKSAVVHLTTHLGTDLIGDNILVNAIAPGYFPSQMTKSIVENEAMTKYALTKIPRGRMGTPEDIAGTALYLASRASAFVCGQTIVVDGGQISTA
jgi:NAD(P)-dependent dehydrogenase (short-subunit alcohol dehydrogenase family)